MSVSTTVEEFLVKIDVDLSPESIVRLLDIPSLLKTYQHVEEIGANTIVIRVPRRLKFMGYRLARLEYKLYEAGYTRIMVARSPTESLIVTVDVIDTEEGSRIVIGASGSGGLNRIALDISQHIGRVIVDKIKSLTPSIELNEDDNKLASSEILPENASLIYTDGFTPVKDVVLEAAQRVLALYGETGNYIVEVRGYREDYLLRMVLRKKSITGLYASVNGEKFVGQRVLDKARRPPEYRVKIKAWSLDEATHVVRIYEPDLVYEKASSKLYLAPGLAPGISPLVPNMYIALRNNAFLIVDPAGGESGLKAIRNIVSDPEDIVGIVVTSPDSHVAETISKIYELVSPPCIAPPTAYASLVGKLPEGKLKVMMNGEFSEFGLEVHGVGSGSKAALIVYDKVDRIAYTGSLFAAVAPPGFWTPATQDADTYLLMVKAYGVREDAVEVLETLDAEVLAPRYGPVLIGRDAVRKLIESVLRR